MTIIHPIPYCDEIPSHFKLGETKAEIKLSNIEDTNNAALSLAEQALYGINIFSQKMDHAIYDNSLFENHVFNLATRHPNARIRILVIDSSAAVQKGHRLIRIAQKLTSSVAIKNPTEKHQGEQSEFMTVDGKGMLYRAQNNKHDYEASVNFMSSQHTGKLDDFFNEAWNHGVRDPQIKRLFI